MLSKFLYQYTHDPTKQQSYQERIYNTARSNLIGYWPLSDLPGTQAIDLSPHNQRADYSTVSIAYGAQGRLAGQRAITMSGVDNYVNIRTSVNTFDTLFDGNNYTLLGWSKVDDIARWNDLAAFRYNMHIRASDVTVYTVMGKTQTANQLTWRRRTIGAITEFLYTFPIAPVDWYCQALSFRLLPTPLLKAFLWDSITGWRIVGSSNAAALTDWGNNPPQEGSTVLGAGSLTAQEWIGSIADCVVWNTTLPDSTIQYLMTP